MTKLDLLYRAPSNGEFDTALPQQWLDSAARECAKTLSEFGNEDALVEQFYGKLLMCVWFYPYGGFSGFPYPLTSAAAYALLSIGETDWVAALFDEGNEWGHP